jgi:hypothetical protein
LRSRGNSTNKKREDEEEEKGVKIKHEREK